MAHWVMRLFNWLLVSTTLLVGCWGVRHGAGRALQNALPGSSAAGLCTCGRYFSLMGDRGHWPSQPHCSVAMAR